VQSRILECSAVHCGADSEARLMKACKVSHSVFGVQQMVRPRLPLRRRSSPQSFAAAHIGEILPEREDRFLKVENRPGQIAPGNADLVANAQKGEEWAFEALFQQHKQRVYSLCLRMTGNPADAEELTQEAFMQVFRKIQTFRGDSAFSTWLHRVSVNTVLMRLRKKTPNAVSLEDSTRDEEFDETPREYGTRDLALDGAIDRMNLKRAMAMLPFGYRQAFVLHDVQGYEHNEIAELLGCSIGNSKSQLHKARVRLRKLLQETDRETRRSKSVQAEAV
jgi:RNA polymerase sigma-70 factor, ECF subfamily